MAETITEIKDANDLMKVLNAEGMSREDQILRVRELLAAATTMVELMAKWAGGLQGAERDAANKIVFKVVAKLDPLAKASYRQRIVDALGIGLRDFEQMWKALAGKDGKEEKPEDIIAIFGDWIPIESQVGEKKGWLLDYIYDPEKGGAKLAYRDPDGKVGVADWLDIGGKRYVPKQPGKFVKDGGVLFASQLGLLKETRELVAIVESFILEHYLLENQYIGKIIAYYVMMTWLYDCFNALPYLRAVGEAGAGKSELMKRIGHLCYRLMTASGANTPASFFRATEMYRGTVFIDEADLYDGGDMSNELVKFLNLGAMRGTPIWRLEETITENGTSYEVATFDTFCPKLIAMRREFKDDAVASRSLTLKLMPREPIELKRAGVKLYIDETFRKRARGIRNLLLRWRLELWKEEIEVNEDEFMDLEISSRLNQVTMPLKAISAADTELQKEITDFLRLYNRELVLTKSMSLEARVVEAMWKIYRYKDLRFMLVKKENDGKEYMIIGDINRKANEIMDEMNEAGDEEAEEGEGEDKKKKKKSEVMKSRKCGSIIRNTLQLEVGERKGLGYPVYWDQLKMEALAKRYGVKWEEYEGHSTAGKDEKQSIQEEIPL